MGGQHGQGPALGGQIAWGDQHGQGPVLRGQIAWGVVFSMVRVQSSGDRVLGHAHKWMATPVGFEALGV